MGVRKVGQSAKVKRRATCKNCGARLEFYRQDVKTQTLYSYGEQDGSYDYVVCPQCDQRVELRRYP